MTQKQRDKHIVDNAAEQKHLLEGTDSPAAEPTPDGLGTWEGGPVALKGSPRWAAEKSKPTRTANTKNIPGTDYASKITHRQDRDFTEIHVEENGDVMLYNVKTDAWDIKGSTDAMPNYEDENGLTWAYNNKTGQWDVPVTYEGGDIHPDAGYGSELTDVNPEVTG